MEKPHDHQKSPGGLGEQQASNELVKLIRKSRWMGLDKDAQKSGKPIISAQSASCGHRHCWVT